MIDPRASLAMAMHANPGVYALLLGSGLSRSASIPTGWEIIEDMIRRVAAASGEDCEPDPETWYREKSAAKPTYSQLLEAVGKSRAERSRLLKAYFEPSQDELERGEKQPTKAHVAIARLVKRGAVRVILSTNFDRLMERALEAEGVSPTVISTPEAIEGASPMAHCDCTLVKLHGDYMDLRTRNTPTELSTYDDRINSLLDRIFDEYGLVVSGWSGDWDEALRKAIERRKGRRFSTWWASVGDPSEAGKRLIEFSQAEKVPIRGADEFFEDLSERLHALDEFDRPHPVSTKVAVTLTKRYLSEPKYRIQLHDLLMGEVDKIAVEVASDRFPVNGSFSDDDYAHRIRAFDATSEIAVHVIATGCFWDEEQQHMDTWLRALSRVANAAKDDGGNVAMLHLRKHPARLLLYAAGVAFAAKDNLHGVYALLCGAKVRGYSKDKPLALALTDDTHWFEVFKTIPDLKQRKVPVSDHTHSVLRPAFCEILPDDTEYENAFDSFEVLQSFYLGDACDWVIPSAYMYRTRDNSPLSRLLASVHGEKANSPFLKAGFCNGSMERFEEVKNMVGRAKVHIGW